MDPTNKVLFEFSNFIESNKLTVLFLTYQKNNFYSNKFTQELVDFPKVLNNYDIFSKCFTEILKKNKNFALNILNIFEYLATIYFMKRDFLRCFNSLEISTKFRETNIAPDIMQKLVINKLMNNYNRIECIVADSKYENCIQNHYLYLEDSKQFLDNFDYRFITSFLDKLLFLYYAQLVNFHLGKIQDFEKYLNFFKGEIHTWNQKKMKEDLVVENLKEYIELKSAILEIKYMEKGQQNRVNDILFLCKQLRLVNIKTNTEFFIKISIKMADIYYILKDMQNCIKVLLSVVMTLKKLTLLPKEFKSRYRYLLYSKLASCFLILRKEKDYSLYLEKFNKVNVYIRKNNIVLPGNGFNNVQIAIMNNQAIYEMKNNMITNTEDHLKVTKEILETGGNVDISLSFVIDNNLACTKFIMVNYNEMINILRKNYFSVINWPSSDHYSLALNNISVGVKTMQYKKWLKVNPNDEFDKILTYFKEKVNEIYNREGYKVTSMFEVRNVIFIYNSICVALNQNRDSNIEVLKKIIDLGIYASKIQEGNFKENIWCGCSDLVLKLLLAQALAWFYKKDYDQVMRVMNILDDISTYINLDTDNNLVNYVRIIKLRADSLYKLGVYNESLTEYSVVIAMYDRLQEYKSENRAAVLYNIGMCFLRLSNVDKGRTFLEESKNMYSSVQASVDKLERIDLVLNLLKQ